MKVKPSSITTLTRDTGALVDYTATVSHGDLTNIMQSKLLASNVWTVGDSTVQGGNSPTSTGAPTSLYIGAAVVAVVVIVVVAVVIVKKRGKSEEEIESE